MLGIPLDACSATQLVETVARWAERRLHRVAVPVNAHLVNLAAADPRLAALLELSGLNYADGQAVVWAARLLGHPVPERVATTNMIEALAGDWAERGLSVFLFGGEPGVAERAAARLALRHPGLVVAGTCHGHLGPAARTLVVDQINASGADVLLVGLGSPLQERWAHANLDRLEPGAILTCGGLFDWVSGRRRPAPRWVGRAGLEWAYRLLLEPRRLARRYLLGNPLFCLRLALALYRRAGVRRG